MSALRGLRPMALRFHSPVPGWGSGSPFHAMEEFMRQMDRAWGSEESMLGSCCTELYKTEDGWILRAQVPGFSKEEIDLDVSKNHISINASSKDSEVEVGKLVRGGFSTSIQYREQIPGAVDPATAEASLVDGVLTVSVKSVVKAQQANKIVIK